LCLTLSLTYVASQLPLFDSSPRLLASPSDSALAKAVYPLLRWDTFHFLHIAQDGYVYEYEWAFFPGAPFVMRTCGEVLRRLSGSEQASVAHLLAGGGLASLLCETVTTLYDLTLHYFGSPAIAYLTCLLSLLPSSPVTLRFSAYTEPFFTYFSYRGMLCCARTEWLHATLFFAVASTFRANGLMLAGYVIWGMVVEPLLERARVSPVQILKSCILTCVVFTPFVYHQYNAYRAFCLDVSASNLSPWCASRLPLVYGYVQAKYWNSGFLLYWTPSQAPNILLAAPVLATLFAFCSLHLKTCTLPYVRSWPPLTGRPRPHPAPHAKSPFLTNTAVIPHALHALALALILLFAAHTQITLRQAAALPTTYWAAAWLVAEHPRAGRCWVTWSVVWGAVSVVLWAVFLPPA
ncbi:glycosyltransferase family 76 protein, partial [Phlebiopsis gigantea 11061_1 CR5-6]